jgi:hypothetical protein
MEEKFVIIKVKNELGESVFELVSLGFETAIEALEYSRNELPEKNDYIVTKYFC